MKRVVLALLVAAVLGTTATARAPHRKIVIPDTREFKVLKCDFHVHTLFSDGWVWPAVRVQEAANEGLDAIAITDHIEHRPWQHLVKGDHNKAHDVAMGKERDEQFLMPGEEVLVIRGAEVSRDMPPGHWNAIFTRDNNPLETESYRDAFDEARRQGAFLFWSHPGWSSQAPNETIWYPEHEKLWKQGYMMGIEVFNPFDGYYPEAFRWALDKNLTIFCNTDTHWPMDQHYDYEAGEHRPVTLVLAREKTEEGIREALEARRTAAFAEDLIIGREEVVKPLFEAMLTVDYLHWEGGKAFIVLKNNSSLPIMLKKAPGSEHLVYKRRFIVRPGEEFKLPIAGLGGFDMATAQVLDLNFFVDNFYVDAPEVPLRYCFRIERP
ncbi:MAG: histidinol-phosphatase [Bacteroidales bacterium]|nr:histidinol-phosphatase [Bacteroidales bacterium]